MCQCSSRRSIGWVSNIWNVADTFGRKTSITLAIFFTRIISGAGYGVKLMAFILAMEIMGKKRQVYGVPWNLTIFSLVAIMFIVPVFPVKKIHGLLAYIFQQWWSYQLAVTFICGLGIFVWFLIPESPRWLIENKKYDDVKKLVIHASELNKMKT